MSTLVWDKSNTLECQQARNTYNRMLGNGYVVYQDGKIAARFDPGLGHMEFRPKSSRYDRLTEDEDEDDGND